MRFHKNFRSVNPWISLIVIAVIAIVLIITIYLTQPGPLWIMFLAGVLVAAILAFTSRKSNAEKTVARLTEQLSIANEKLEHETHLRRSAEKSIVANQSRLNLIDEIFPTMVLLVDTEGNCRYHNRAFRDWLHLRPDQINTKHMRNVLGTDVYQETATAIRQSLNGKALQYERIQTMSDGAIYRLSIEHLPQFDEEKKVTGFYMLINDITKPSDIHFPTDPGSSSDQDLFVDSYSAQVNGQQDAALIRRAIERGEFSLYCQLISPLSGNPDMTEHYEILVRLLEEEESMLPPGAFFPLAEKHGLMTHLDRWVVQHVTEWVSRNKTQNAKPEHPMYFINVSGATIADPGFPEFLQLTLLEYGVSGSSLCFEVSDTELSSKTADVAEFARQIRKMGCRVALSGFGRDKVLFDLIRGFQVEFLKIDGSIILNMIHNPLYLAKVKSINHVGKKIGVRIIAELVESEEIITALGEIGVDFAQGFAISRPKPLDTD